MSKMHLYTHPDCEKHELAQHPERPERLRAVTERLQVSGLVQDMQVCLATEPPDNLLNLVHPEAYVESVNQSEPTDSIIRLDPDTYMSPGSLRAAKLAAGACISAVKDILDGKTERAFCAIRPPGHHAELAAAMGFCIFNNIALAAETALTYPGINRVAIVDFDVHHCNGTVDIFKDRSEVMVCSSFQQNHYPYRYLDYTNDHIVNSPLPAGTDGSAFRSAIEQDWLPALQDHRPDLLLISAGFDAHELDPLADLRLREADYKWITAALADIAADHANNRIMSTLEGGYHLTALADSVEAHVAELLQYN